MVGCGHNRQATWFHQVKQTGRVFPWKIQVLINFQAVDYRKPPKFFRKRVKSPKTEHHAGRVEPIVPLFPELRVVLMEAFEQAEPGETRIAGACTDKYSLRTQFQRIIRRAGLEP